MSVSLEHWRGRMHPEYFEEHKRRLLDWLSWVKENPDGFSRFSLDDFMNFQRNAVGDQRFAILDLVQRWVSEKKIRAGSKKTYYSSVRSFFMHNRAELPADRSFQIFSDKPAVVGNLTREELRRVIDASNLVHRTIFLSMYMGGMGIGELIFWSNNEFEATQRQLELSADFIKIDLPGRKKSRNIRPFYTFIGGDALDTLKKWMMHRNERDQGSIFLTQHGTPVTKFSVYLYWLRKLRQLGLIGEQTNDTGTRYGKNLHEVRDLFRSRWQKSGRAPEVAEFFMGHRVDPLGYNKAMRDEDYTRREYRQAMAWLNILSQDPEKIPIDEHERQLDRIEVLERQITEMQPAAEEVGALQSDIKELREMFKTLIEKPDLIEIVKKKINAM